MQKNLVDLTAEEIPDEIKQALAFITDTEAGVLFFQWLYELCGQGRSSIMLDGTSKIDAVSTVNEESRRALWLYIQPYIPRRRLIDIMLPEPAKPKVEDIVSDALAPTAKRTYPKRKLLERGKLHE